MNKLECDVAVIAAGPAGLAAALTAAEGGARVMVFEKGSTTGGTGNMGMGPLAVESRLQRAKQIDLTTDKAFKIFMDYTHWRVDARLVRTYLDKSADTIDWLEKMGVEFVEPAAYFPGANFTWHLIKPDTGLPGPMASGTMMRIMTVKAKELGIQIFLKATAKKILKQSDRIVGVMVEGESEESIQVAAKAVVIATGGFGDNPDMIKKYTGYEFGKDLFSFRIPGLAGDGIHMAWEIGAAPSEMNMELIYGIPNLMDPGIMAVFRQADLMVNLLGERFINEEITGNTTFTGNAIARQKNRCAFIIFDEDIKKHYEKNGLDFLVSIAPHLRIDNIDVGIKNALDFGNDHIFVTNSLEELAAKTGIDIDGLKATVEEYNKYCEKGYDPLFNKSHRYLRPIKQPRFYAARNFPSAYGSLGGIKINHRTEVLTKDWKKIPGLYAAGTDVCSIYGDSYVFVLPGNTMGFALNTGRIAGEKAAEYAKSLR